MTQLSANSVIDIIKQPNKAMKLSLSEWSQFIFILRECELLARFYYLSQEDQVFNQYPEQAQRHLHSAKIKADRQARQAVFEAEQLNENLKKINVQPIFLKGVAYTLLNNKASLGRTYSDMDVLVPKSELKKIERYLTLYGWFAKKTDDYDDKYYREWAHEIPPMFQTSRGTVADIHHNLLPPVSGRAPNINLFTQQLQKTTSGTTTLSNAGLVLHSIIHLFFNEEFEHSFRDIIDLDLFFEENFNNQSFWNELFGLAQSSNFHVELYYAYRYCQKLLGSQFPEKFITKVTNFKPSNIRLLIADYIFLRVLLPNHSSFNTRAMKISRSLAFIRGHLLKMPLHILIYHSLHKFFTQLKKEPENNNKFI